MNYYWTKDEVLGKLDVKMTEAYIGVSEFARRNGFDLRKAAYVIAVERVAEASRDRGWV
jgi:glutamate dehydrogenase (NAD(P)+)